MQMIGRMILVILFIMLSPCRAGIAAQFKMSLYLFLVSEKKTAQLGARCPSAALSDVRLWGHASGFDV